MKYAINVPERPALPVKGLDYEFPIARVFGIGRNYSETPEQEEKDPKKIVLFMKDAYMLSLANNGITYPSDTTKLRYEIELVVAIGKSGSNITPMEANDYIYGYAIGMDFTKYDLQDIAKKNGWPWDKGKSFPGCAPCTCITHKSKCDIDNNTIWLKKNGELVQRGNLKQMIWEIPEIISVISKKFYLFPGDLIFTGTPKGVGMVEKGDQLIGGIDKLGIFELEVK